MNKGFINILGVAIIGIALIISGATLVYTQDRLSGQDQRLGSTVTQTNLTDTLNTFRTNVNSSLLSLQADLNYTTTTDPGHKHTTSTVTGVFGFSNGGVGITSTPTDSQILIGATSTYFLTTIPNCNGTSSDKLLYASGTHSWTCGADQGIGYSGGPNQQTGDLLYASGTTLYTRLSSSTPGLILRTSSTPMWDGLAIRRQVGASAGSGTTNETTVSTSTIPGGLLGTNRGLRITVHGSASDADAVTVRIKYGTSTFYTASGVAAGNSFIAIAEIFNNNSANAQIGGGRAFLNAATPEELQINQTANIDSTISQNVTVTLDKDATNNGNAPNVYLVFIEVL